MPAENMVKLSFRIRSWVYELGGVLGISLATNLLAAEIASPSSELRTWHYSIGAWFVFGVASLYYAYKLREQENTWERKTEKSKWNNVAEWTQSELNGLKRIECALGIIILSFVIGTLLLCQSVTTQKQTKHAESSAVVPTKPAP